VKDLLLIDLGAIYYPVWHAVPPSEPAGKPHDVTVDRVRRMAEAAPGHVAICADSPRNWRYDLLPTYKANRESKGEACIAQLRRVAETLRLDGFAVWQVDGYEADDVIAAATKQARKAGLLVTIATADKDLAQLVAEGVGIHSVKTGLDMGPAEVLAKFGVRPDQLGDWLALVGDKADNVPGIPGIGAVKATALLTQWGYLASLMQAAADDAADTAAATERGEVVEAPRLDPKLRAKLLEHKDALSVSRQLVALRDDVPLDFGEALRERVRRPLPTATDWEETEMSEPENENAEAQRAPEVPAAEPSQPESTPEPARPMLAAQQPSKALTIDPNPAGAIQAPAGVDGWAMALEPTNPTQAFQMAKALHNARIFPNLDSPERIFAAMMLGRSIGVGTITICQLVHVISGKLTLHASMIEGLCMKASQCEYFACVETSAKSATYETKRHGSPVQRITYTLAEAEAAGLTSNAQYKKRPAVMLRHRAATDLARMVYPDVVGGLYSPDELDDDRRTPGKVAA